MILKAAGWGKVESGRQSAKLLDTEMIVRPEDKTNYSCKRMAPAVFCATGPGESGICGGDSGGIPADSLTYFIEFLRTVCL